MMDRFRLSCPEHPRGLATVGHFGPMTPITHQVSAQQISILLSSIAQPRVDQNQTCASVRQALPSMVSE